MREPRIVRARGHRRFAALGSLRVRLTAAVAVLSGAGLALGSALLVRGVEATVIRAIDDQSRAELVTVGTQIASGVPIGAIGPVGAGRRLYFLRADGTRLDVAWGDPSAGAPPPLPPPPLRVLIGRGPPPGAPPPCIAVTGEPSAPPPGPAATVESPPPGAPAPSARVRVGSPGAAPPPNPTVIAEPPPDPRLQGVLAQLGQPLPDVGVHGSGPPDAVGPAGTPERWSSVELPMFSPEYGPVSAVAASPLQDVLRSTDTLRRVLEIGVPALVALLTAAAWLLIGRALRPVRVMTQTAAGIADATAPERLAVPTARDELGELADTLNGMLDRLAEGARRQREFVSDASHELRSPIAATRTQIEVALAHPERADPAAVLHGVLAETTRLELLVADLLALARLDERQPLVREEIDLDDLVLEDAMRSRAIAVDIRGVTAVKVHGERRSLRHLVRNLLDNAARHAARRVEISTELEAGAAVLRVDDDGPGIPEADRARVFERFTRLSPGRSRDDGGAGLGLALVRRVAEQHGGAVRADRSPLGGARLEVRFAATAGGDTSMTRRL